MSQGIQERRSKSRWTIGAKLGLGFGAMIALTVVVAGVGYRSILMLTGSSAATAQASLPAVDRSLQLQTEIHHALSMHRGYMILGLESLAAERLSAWEKIDGHFEALAAMSAGWDDEDRALLAQIEGVMAEFRSAQDRIAAIAHTPGDLPATERFSAETLPLSERVVASLNAMLEEEASLPATPERKALALAMARAESHLLRVRGAIASYLESGAEDGVEAIASEASACGASVERLVAMSGLLTPGQASAFEAYLLDRSAFLDSAEIVVADRSSDSFCVSEDICLNTVTPLSQEADGLIASLVERQRSVRDGATAEVAAAGDSARSSLPVLVVVSLGAMAIGAGIAVYFGRSIARAVKKVSMFAERIARHDLSHTEFDVNRSDEIGTLGHAVGRMAGALRSLIEEVNAAAHEVGSAATEIAASNEQMAAAIYRQSTEVEQISGAVTEMTASISEVANRSEEAARQAEASGETAGTGGQIVRETVDGMSSIDSAVRDSAASVEELGRRGEQIGGIIEVINEIAEQTNLLALNAAIEAARAGEHGRGFAVVADEVRKLAERTTVATEEVTRSVKAIQDETGLAVERMQSGTRHVTTGVELATRAGQSLEEIVASAGAVKLTIDSIATAAQQQSEVAAEVSRGIEAINSESRQSAQATEQSAAASAELASKAEHLRGLMQAFTL